MPIDILPTNSINTVVISPLGLKRLLYDIKDQLEFHPRLRLPSDIKDG